MPDWLSIHEPVLVNTVGHCAGAVIFGILLYFFLVDWRRAREQRSLLPAAAAALAMLWNLGSLVALAAGRAGGTAADVIVAISFSVLSVLPAVLLHISLEPRHRPLWVSGYVLSAVAVALHIADLATQAASLHFAALLLVTVGFASLTIVSVWLELRESKRAAVSRLAGAMGLFLFAISFAHFGSGHARQAWSSEAALHHAGLPLALFVLLQDYRFLLLDAFLRFVVNASLAAAAILISIPIVRSPGLMQHLNDPFSAGLLFVAAGLLLTLFVGVHNGLQGWLTRVIFLRSNVDDAALDLHQAGLSTQTESQYLAYAAEAIARFMRAARFHLSEDNPLEEGRLTTPAAVMEPSNWRVGAWAEAVVPFRFSRGDARYLLLGQRDGGRRFLSEDFAVLGRLAATVTEHIEQVRSIEMQNLVSKAELKALQAQINPHFLFNSLNTLYGTIDRGNTEARRLVLNLSDVFRYLLRSERTFVEIEEELKIVQAYLEIEQLRLGPKLRTELAIDPNVLKASIPLLSIQPLVENAVKHGVAARAGTGFVRLSINSETDGIAVQVCNSGEWDARAVTSPGIGLANVGRRLELCYGVETSLQKRVAGGVTTVGFLLPLKNSRRIPALA